MLLFRPWRRPEQAVRSWLAAAASESGLAAGSGRAPEELSIAETGAVALGRGGESVPMGFSSATTPWFEGSDAMWEAVYAEYQRWFREEIAAIAQPFWRGEHDRSSWPRYSNSEDDRAWWACLTYEKVRNFELALTHKANVVGQTPLVPETIGGLPVEADAVPNEADAHEAGGLCTSALFAHCFRMCIGLSTQCMFLRNARRNRFPGAGALALC